MAAAATAPDGKRTRSHLRWWHGLVALALLLITFLASAWLYYERQWDLDPIRERAAALGIATDPATLETPVDEDARRWFDELERLQDEGLVPFRHSDGYDPQRHEARPHRPLPAAWFEHHRPQQQLSERFLALIRRTSELPSMRASQPSWFANNNDHVAFVGLRQYASFMLHELLLLCPAEELPQRACEALSWSAAQPSCSFMDLLMRGSVDQSILSAIRHRWPVIIAEADDKERQRLLDLLDESPSRTIAIHARCYEHFSAEVFQALADGRQPAPLVMTEPEILDPILLRTSRAHHLDRQLTVIDRIRNARDYKELLFSYRLEEQRLGPIRGRDTWLPAFTTFCQRHCSPVTTILTKIATRQHLLKRLFIAELQQSPWPIDLFDPQSAPLRRLEADGRLLGAYSVGPDGFDHGGDPDEDDVHWLYGARDRDGTVHWGGDLVRSP